MIRVTACYTNNSVNAWTVLSLSILVRAEPSYLDCGCMQFVLFEQSPVWLNVSHYTKMILLTVINHVILFWYQCMCLYFWNINILPKRLFDYLLTIVIIIYLRVVFVDDCFLMQFWITDEQIQRDQNGELYRFSCWW